MEKKVINLIKLPFALLLSIMITSWLNTIFNNYSISPVSVVYFLTGLIGFYHLIHNLLELKLPRWIRTGIVILFTIIEELIIMLIHSLQTNMLVLSDFKALILLLLINAVVAFQLTSKDLVRLIVAIMLALFESLAIWFNLNRVTDSWDWLVVILSLNILINLVALQYVKKIFYWLLSTIAGILFALALVLGKPLYDNYQFPSFNLITVLTFLGLFLFWTTVTALIINFVINNQNQVKLKNENKKIQNWFNQIQHPWLWSTIITFIIFLPALVALAPGIWSYDTPYQYFSMVRGNWNIGQPIASMMIVYFFVQIIGVQLLHSLTVGLFLMILTQFVLGAIIFGYGFKVLNKWHLPWFIQVIVWGWWSLHITNWTSLALSNTKDTWAGLASVLIMIFLLEIWQNGTQFLHSYGKITILIIALFVFLTFRNSSRLVLIMFLPFLLGFCWKYWKQMLTICVATGALFYLFNGPVVHSLSSTSSGIQTEGVRNISNVGGLKIQLIFGGYINAGYQFSTSDKKLLWSILPQGTPEQYAQFYSPQFADQAANVWGELGQHYPKIYHGDFNKRRSQMMKRIILHYPKAALQVILNQNLGWYYPQSIYPSKSGNIYNEVINETKNGPMKKDGVIIKNWNWWPSLYKIIYDLEQDGNYWQYPVIASFFDPAFWGWLILIMLLILIAKKSWSALVISFFVVIQWATLWAAPVVLARYIYPIFLCLPLMLVLCYLKQPNIPQNDRYQPLRQFQK
ncbi:DUF6020 family protein [Bombilactobacillus bombi]|uniref:DUF6020 family protein n=1 Tax=Bombilactobacillus bombi TaxID=1303590 RepID=UPI0015E5D8EF|nr:DUF6020 family protein [Bombilactobacillus bombi]MBA1435148.1 hypothetical protein [Bombilactobacillus bombi]